MRSVGRRPLLTAACILVVAAGGLGLSVWASFTQACALSCGSWTFEPWWAFWVSLVAFGVCVASLVLAARSGWPLRTLGVAALAAVLALVPLPLELWRENELRRVVEGVFSRLT